MKMKKGISIEQLTDTQNNIASKDENFIEEKND